MTQTLPQQNAFINGRKYDEVLFLVDPKLGVIHELNGVGARIWELCDGQLTEQEAAQHLANEFEVGLLEAQQDLSSFVQALLAKGLLVSNERLDGT